MRPLWLVFQNQDGLGDDILQIFKNGDGRVEHMLHVTFMHVIWAYQGQIQDLSEGGSYQ